MIQKQDFERLIELYTKAKMKDKELEWFKSELETDSALMLEFQLDQQIRRALLQNDILDLRRKLIAIKKSNHNLLKIVPIQFILKKSRIAAAAISLMLMIAGGYYIYHIQNYSNERLFTNYYNIESTFESSRSTDKRLSLAMTYYQNKQFEKAILAFNHLLKQNPNNSAVLFYAGLSYIEVDKLDKAIASFQSIIKDNDNLYLEHAQWYLGLCYLKANMNDQAEIEFQQIAKDPSNYFNMGAKEILKKIK